jgi:hypothetical protein
VDDARIDAGDEEGVKACRGDGDKSRDVDEEVAGVLPQADGADERLLEAMRVRQAQHQLRTTASTRQLSSCSSAICRGDQGELALAPGDRHEPALLKREGGTGTALAAPYRLEELSGPQLGDVLGAVGAQFAEGAVCLLVRPELDDGVGVREPRADACVEAIDTEGENVTTRLEHGHGPAALGRGQGGLRREGAHYVAGRHPGPLERHAIWLS